jgi:UDP-hydrolysing UDP-N-acetyl-D-glucosamine 2-epimerase
MGEEPWRVIVSGAPALDELRDIQLLSLMDLESRIGMELDPAPLLVTFHPTTLEYERANEQVVELLSAIDEVARPIVITYPNADTSGRLILEHMRSFVRTHPNSRLIDNLGTQAYFSLLGRASAMVGNSSSGIIEAPSFALPVVNIGSRQAGRCRGSNVIDVPCERTVIQKALERVLSPEFKAGLLKSTNPYWRDGRASERIVRKLVDMTIDDRLVTKCFVDLGEALDAT